MTHPSGNPIPVPKPEIKRPAILKKPMRPQELFPLAQDGTIVRSLYGNFDIILFFGGVFGLTISRTVSSHKHPASALHAPCAVLHVVPIHTGC